MTIDGILHSNHKILFCSLAKFLRVLVKTVKTSEKSAKNSNLIGTVIKMFRMSSTLYFSRESESQVNKTRNKPFIIVMVGVRNYLEV